MLARMEEARRASAAIILKASAEESAAARSAGNMAIFRASAFGYEEPPFLGKIFAEPEGLGLQFGGHDDAMDLTP